MKSAANKKRPGCESKKRYETIEAAKTGIMQMVRKKAAKGDPIVTYLRAYGCACGGFHVGKSRDINWDAFKALEAERQKARAA